MAKRRGHDGDLLQTKKLTTCNKKKKSKNNVKTDASLEATIRHESGHNNSSHFQSAFAFINRSYLLPGSHPP